MFFAMLSLFWEAPMSKSAKKHQQSSNNSKMHHCHMAMDKTYEKPSKKQENDTFFTSFSDFHVFSVRTRDENWSKTDRKRIEHGSKTGRKRVENGSTMGRKNHDLSSASRNNHKQSPTNANKSSTSVYQTTPCQKKHNGHKFNGCYDAVVICAQHQPRHGTWHVQRTTQTCTILRYSQNRSFQSLAIRRWSSSLRCDLDQHETTREEVTLFVNTQHEYGAIGVIWFGPSLG